MKEEVPLFPPPKLTRGNFPNSEEKIGPELAQPAKKFLKD